MNICNQCGKQQISQEKNCLDCGASFSLVNETKSKFSNKDSNRAKRVLPVAQNNRFQKSKNLSKDPFPEKKKEIKSEKRKVKAPQEEKTTEKAVSYDRNRKRLPRYVPYVSTGTKIRKSTFNLFCDAVCIAMGILIGVFVFFGGDLEAIKNFNKEEQAVSFLGTGAQITMGGDLLIENGVLLFYSGQDSQVDIPNGVMEIAPQAFFRNPYVKTVTIPSSVMKIGKEAFSTCTSLEKVSFSDGLMEIQESAFAFCGKLIEVTLPSSVKTLGDYAFSNCSSLTYLTLSPQISHIPEGAFQECDIHYLEIPEGIQTIGGGAFYGAPLGQGVQIPITVSYIDYMAFGNSEYDLSFQEQFNMVGDGVLIKYIGEDTHITLPDYVKSIGGGAFTGSSQGGIVIPSTVTSIGGGAFLESNLSAIEIPDTVTYIGDYAFLSCYNLETVHFNQENTSLGQAVFAGTPWLRQLTEEFTVSEDGVLLHYGGSNEELVIPDNITAIGGGAFEGSTVKKILIPDTVTSIEAFAFQNATELTSVNLPSHLTTIEMGLFKGCSSLESITIPPSVTEIGEGAFQGCISLNGMLLPPSVEQIGVSAFHECSGLQFVVLGDGLRRIPNHTFAGLENLESVLIGNAVTSIGDGAFAGCNNLVSVTFGFSVTSIGQSAFASCSSLETPYFPEGLQSIEAYAFAGCVSMKEAILPDGLLSLGVESFARCASLETMQIPASVTYIGTDMFVDSAIYYVVLPKGSMADAWVKDQSGVFRVLYT